jgi:hypothetical protein
VVSTTSTWVVLVVLAERVDDLEDVRRLMVRRRRAHQLGELRPGQVPYELAGPAALEPRERHDVVVGVGALRAVEVERRAARLIALDGVVARLIVAGDGRRRLVDEPAAEVGGRVTCVSLMRCRHQHTARLPAADRDRQRSALPR